MAIQVLTQSQFSACDDKDEHCPKCNRPTTEDQQHGIVRYADESGDGLVHDGGCDRCCACRADGALVIAVAYVTWGSVRGLGPVRLTEAVATRDLRADQRDCGRQGGYSDRKIYAVDCDGWARDHLGGYVYPHGAGLRALRVTPPMPDAVDAVDDDEGLITETESDSLVRR